MSEEDKLEKWLEEIALEINMLSNDAFKNNNLNAFRKRKNKILIHFVGVTASIEELFEIKEETKCSD